MTTIISDKKISSALIGGFLAGTVLLVKSRKKRPVAVGQIDELVFYPVKSLSGISVPQLLVHPNSCVSFGGLHDRQFSLIDGVTEHGLLLSVEPSLALIDLSIHVNSSGTQLWFDAPGAETLKVI